MTGRLLLPGLLALVTGVYLLTVQLTEPYFNGDETRHVMTGAFVADALRDGGYRTPRAYAERYYTQYPALGLLVWPPGLYAVEGLVMLVTGPSYPAARAIVFGYHLLACGYLFALARRTHGPATAAVAVLLFAVARDVVAHTQHVMLEMPLTACALAATFHLERYLSAGRRRELVLLVFWTVAAGLHRYDAVFLGPLFVLRVLFARRPGLLVRREVLLAGAAAVGLLLPVYLPMIREIGGMQGGAASRGTSSGDQPHGLFETLISYPSDLWYSLGHVAMAVAPVGLVLSFRKGVTAAPYWATLAAVYLTFTPLAEHESRHALPWLPAWCVLIADAALLPARCGRLWLAVLCAAAVVGHSAFWTYKQPPRWVRGYAAAAEYVRDHTAGPAVVLFDGLQDGTFIFETRRADPDRRVWVARGDKLLYAVRSDPAAGYVEWAASDDDILKLLENLDPDFLVIEDKPAKYDLPMARRLRAVLAANADRFRPVQTVPVESSNVTFVEGVSLVVYRPTQRHPDRPRTLRMNMLWQGTTVEAAVR